MMRPQSAKQTRNTQFAALMNNDNRQTGYVTSFNSGNLPRPSKGDSRELSLRPSTAGSLSPSTGKATRKKSIFDKSTRRASMAADENKPMTRADVVLRMIQEEEDLKPKSLLHATDIESSFRVGGGVESTPKRSRLSSIAPYRRPSILRTEYGDGGMQTAPSGPGLAGLDKSSTSLGAFSPSKNTKFKSGIGTKQGYLPPEDKKPKDNNFNKLWTNISPGGVSPGGREGASLTLADGKFYLFGGIGKERFNDVFVLDPSADHTWRKLASTGTTPTPRCYHATVYDPRTRNIYFYGGEDQSGQGMPMSALDDLYSFNIDTHHWLRFNVMGYPPRVRGHTMAMVDKQLIIFGGWNPHSRLQPYGEESLFVVDIDHMYARAAMREQTGTIPSARHGHTWTLVGRKLYVIGGISKDYSNDVYILDVETMHWTKPLITGDTFPARFGHSTFLFEGKLIIVGGRDQHRLLDDLWVLDTMNHRWIGHQKLGIRRFGHASAVRVLKESAYLYITGGVSERMEGSLLRVLNPEHIPNIEQAMQSPRSTNIDKRMTNSQMSWQKHQDAQAMPNRPGYDDVLPVGEYRTESGLNKMYEELTHLKGNASTMESELREARKRCNHLEGVFIAKDEDIAELKRQLEEMQNEHNRLKSQVYKHDEDRAQAIREKDEAIESRNNAMRILNSSASFTYLETAAAKAIATNTQKIVDRLIMDAGWERFVMNLITQVVKTGGGDLESMGKQIKQSINQKVLQWRESCEEQITDVSRIEKTKDMLRQSLNVAPHKTDEESEKEYLLLELQKQQDAKEEYERAYNKIKDNLDSVQALAAEALVANGSLERSLMLTEYMYLREAEWKARCERLLIDMSKFDGMDQNSVGFYQAKVKLPEWIQRAVQIMDELGDKDKARQEYFQSVDDECAQLERMVVETEQVRTEKKQYAKEMIPLQDKIDNLSDMVLDMFVGESKRKSAFMQLEDAKEFLRQTKARKDRAAEKLYNTQMALQNRIKALWQMAARAVMPKAVPRPNSIEEEILENRGFAAEARQKASMARKRALRRFEIYFWRASSVLHELSEEIEPPDHIKNKILQGDTDVRLSEFRMYSAQQISSHIKKIEAQTGNLAVMIKRLSEGIPITPDMDNLAQAVGTKSDRPS